MALSRKLVVVLLRILLVAVLVVDVGLVSMIFQHWLSGGVDGVKAWIVHTHATFQPNRWEIPVEQLARDSYREFASLAIFLVAITAVLLLGERRVSRKLTLGGGHSTATTR